MVDGTELGNIYGDGLRLEDSRVLGLLEGSAVGLLYGVDVGLMDGDELGLKKVSYLD